MLRFATEQDVLKEIEAVFRRSSVKKVVLKIAQNLQEKYLCQGLFLNKVLTLLKKRFWQSSFPVNFARSLRTPFLIEQLRWLLL